MTKLQISDSEHPGDTEYLYPVAKDKLRAVTRPNGFPLPLAPPTEHRLGRVVSQSNVPSGM